MGPSDQWRYTDDDGVQRLVDADELRAALSDGRLKPGTLVWRRGMKQWLPAASVSELAPDPFVGRPLRSPLTSEIGSVTSPTASIPPPLAQSGDPPTERRKNAPMPENLVDMAALQKQRRRRQTDLGIGGAAAPSEPAPGAQPRPDAAGMALPLPPKVPTEVDGKPLVEVRPSPSTRSRRTTQVGGLWTVADERRATEETTTTMVRPDLQDKGGLDGATTQVKDDRAKAAPTAGAPATSDAAGAKGKGMRMPHAPAEPKAGLPSLPPLPLTRSLTPPPPPVVKAAADGPRVRTVPPPAGKPADKPKAATPTPAAVEPKAEAGARPARRSTPPPAPHHGRAKKAEPAAAAASPAPASAPKEAGGAAQSKAATPVAPAVAPSPVAAALGALAAPAPAAGSAPLAATPTPPPSAPFELTTPAATKPKAAPQAKPKAAPQAKATTTAKTAELPARGQATLKMPSPLDEAPPAADSAPTARPAEPAATAPAPTEAAGSAGSDLTAELPRPQATAAATPAPAPWEANHGAEEPSPPATTTSRDSWPRVPAPSRRAAALTIRLSALIGVAVVMGLLIASSFLVGRLTAPAHAGLAGGIRARTGFATVPLFARSTTTQATGPRPCLMLRAPAKWAASASKSIPFEMLATPDGKLAVGYAIGLRQVQGMLVDPDTGIIEEQFTPDEGREELSRVVPLLDEEGKVRYAETLANQAGVRNGVWVGGQKPFIVGFKDDACVALDAPDAEPRELWKLEPAGTPDALRAVAVPGQGAAISYRHDNRNWYGWLKVDGTVGVPVKALGEPLAEMGKPMVGYNGEQVSLMWADRPTKEDTAVIRWAKVAPGAAIGEAQLIELPPGGPGGDAIAPAVAGLSGGRWAMMWTEGSRGKQRVLRAQTYARDGSRIGDALQVSPGTGSFGQGTVGVKGESAAVVFLLQQREGFRVRYELWGTVLQCQ